MSLSFANAVAAGLKANGVPVKYHAGWETEGNGQVSAYEGLIWHHTATGYANDPPAILWQGRPDLDGPLCNTSGNADGSITIISANPANHAGASGGRNTAPLPVTTLFNRRVWGHEIVYPGTQPMTAAQYRSALILGGVIMGICKHPTTEWCKGHADTSVTGKWDPGYANGKTVDLNQMRADVWPALFTEESDLPLSDADKNDIARRVWEFTVTNRFQDHQPVEMADILTWLDLRMYNTDARVFEIDGAMPGIVNTLHDLVNRPDVVAKSLPDVNLNGLAQAVCDEMDSRAKNRLALSNAPKGVN